MTNLHTLETPRYENLLHSASMMWASAQRWNAADRWQECAHYLMGMASACSALLLDNDKQEAFESLHWLASVAINNAAREAQP